MTKKWVIRENKLPEDVAEELKDYQELARQLLFYRAIKTKAEAEIFLHPNYERDIYDPFLMLGMERAVERIFTAIRDNERLVIFGDYDADGMSGSAILYSFFQKIGFKNFHAHIPNRYKEGYGLTLGAIDEFIKNKTNLIITVDCGITDVEEVEKANKNDIDVIITDHHLVHDKAPNAYAILDSKQENDPYPFKFLSGAGVAFKLVQGLVKRGKEKEFANLGVQVVEGWEKWLLDLAAVATIADMVPIQDENRVLAYYGLKVLQKNKRVGFNALLRRLKINNLYVDEGDVGFMIAPRINTASRMGHATTSFELLTTDDMERAQTIAKELENKNGERKEEVQKILDSVEGKYLNEEPPKVIVLGDVEWLPGVLGLAANRLMEKYLRPVFLWGQKDSSDIKGSCRSDGSINLVKFMGEFGEIFVDFGGHAMAGGFNVVDGKVDLLEGKVLETFAKAEKMENGFASLEIDSKLLLDEVTSKTWDIIKTFAPFGIDNPKPLFLFENIVIEIVKEFGNGGIHLELSFRRSDSSFVKAIGFFMNKDKFKDICLGVGVQIDLVASMELSMFRNIPELRLRIEDIKASKN